MSQKKLAILISGRGSNMMSLAEACAANEIEADVALVLSNRRDAAGIEKARALGLTTDVIEHTAFDSREDFDKALSQRLEITQPDLILLAGFMRILGDAFVQRWEGKVLNIHPSLLPRYPGRNTHTRAIEAGDTKAGASVHVVTNELDAGTLIAQVEVPIKPDDTPGTLEQRVIQQEHALYVNAVKQWLDDNNS